MIALVRNYADRPEAEWRPLFHRILQSRIRDFARRSSIRSRFRAWLGNAEEDDGDENPIDEVADPRGAGPAELAEGAAAGAAVLTAVRELPLRQQQAFVLRAWEGLDVAETAAAMECSEGSVKTHYFRALQALRGSLEGEWR